MTIRFLSSLAPLFGTGLTAFALAGGTQDYLTRLPRAECHADVQLIICDQPISSETLQKYSDSSSFPNARILSIRTADSKGWVPATGRVRLSSSDTETKSRLCSLQEQDRIQANGALVLPESSIAGGFSYRNYLKSAGIFRELKIDAFSPLPAPPPTFSQKWQNILRNCRIALTENLLNGLANCRNARMAAALGMGQKHFLESDFKQQLSRAGIVHVFAISGLHIGLVAAMLLFALRWCGFPLRICWFSTSVLVFVYVLLTGFYPSSIRALGMTVIMFCAWFKKRPSSALNAMGLIGLLAMLINPLVIYNSGFVYSYTVVFALVFCWPGLNTLVLVADERNFWIPRQLRKNFLWHRWGRAILSVFLVSILAWLTSSGITLCQGGRLCLISPIVNLPLAVIVPAALFFCLLKMTLGMIIPSTVPILNIPLNASLSSLAWLTDFAANSSLCLENRMFSWQEAFVYHLLLWLLFCSVRNSSRLSIFPLHAYANT